MSKEKKISEMENKKEQFVALAKEVYPLIEQIREAMAKSPFGDSASISIGSDGYVEFRPYDSGWRLNRYRCDSTPVAQYEYQGIQNHGTPIVGDIIFGLQNGPDILPLADAELVKFFLKDHFPLLEEVQK